MLAIPGWYAEIKRETIAFIKHLIAAWGGQCTSTFLIGVGGISTEAVEHKKVRGASKSYCSIRFMLHIYPRQLTKHLFLQLIS
jgi:hypothetical protein